MKPIDYTGNTHPGAVLPFGWMSACGYSGGLRAATDEFVGVGKNRNHKEHKAHKEGLHS